MSSFVIGPVSSCSCWSLINTDSGLICTQLTTYQIYQWKPMAVWPISYGVTRLCMHQYLIINQWSLLSSPPAPSTWGVGWCHILNLVQASWKLFYLMPCPLLFSYPLLTVGQGKPTAGNLSLSLCYPLD